MLLKIHCQVNEAPVWWPVRTEFYLKPYRKVTFFIYKIMFNGFCEPSKADYTVESTSGDVKAFTIKSERPKIITIQPSKGFQKDNH